ncbi:MAG TPA: 30S ribosome-binding factor RbfA [Candidatus Limnocylindrales bacterium]|nr:30S ribosome-binding factor RbfA [Candidatus Limnocylindrales bacterium]
MTQRTDRIDELLREEMTSILARDVGDPRIGFATITDIQTAPDLRHAKVLVSVIGQPAERRATLAALGHAMPFVRHELGKRLRLRRIPEFHLELDDSVERGTRILHLLDELEAGTAPDAPPAEGETLPTPRPIVADDEEGEALGAAAAEVAARENARRRTRRASPRPPTPARRRR